MDTVDLWELDAVEAIQDFLGCPDFNIRRATEMLEALGLSENASPIIHDPKTLAVLQGGSDYTISDKEVRGLSVIRKVAYYPQENCLSIMICDLDTMSEDDTYIACATLIKIMNKALQRSVLYFFRSDECLCLGAKRVQHASIANNFCVSDLFSLERAGMIVAILEDTDSIDDISMNIRLTSSREPNVYKQQKSSKIYDIDTYRSFDRLSFYEEHSERAYYRTLYVDFCYDHRRKLSSCSIFDPDFNEIDYFEPHLVGLSYQDACHELVGIAEVGGQDDNFDIDFLDTLLDIEEDNTAEDLLEFGDDIDEDEQIDDEDIEDLGIEAFNLSIYSDDAYDNAEQMLKEIMESPPSTSAQQHNIKTNELSSEIDSSEWILIALKKAGIPYRDKRDRFGCLWIAGGNELDSFIEICKEHGYKFHFKMDGCKAFPTSPVWWTKDLQE